MSKPRKAPDPQELRKRLLYHVADYLRTTPVAERNAAALKACTDILSTVGADYERAIKEKAARDSTRAMAMPFDAPTDDGTGPDAGTVEADPVLSKYSGKDAK